MACFDEGREPTAQQIADDLGVNSKPLGVKMSAAGLQARNVRRGGKRVRRYTFDQRKKIEDVLDTPGGYICKNHKTTIGLSDMRIFIDS